MDAKINLAGDQYYWYHTVEFPELGVAKGAWELSQVPEKFLGGVDFKGKKTLEVGAASGRITLELERLGAKVTAVDIGGEFLPDALTLASVDQKPFLNRLNNSHRLVREVFNLKARYVNGTVYNPFDERYDIGVVGNILLHLRDPFKALYNIARATDKTVLVVDSLWNWPLFAYQSLMACVIKVPYKLMGHSYVPEPALFMPQPGLPEQCVWWYLRPSLLKRMLAILGFAQCRVIYHQQVYNGRKSLQYTLIANRTSPGVIMET